MRLSLKDSVFNNFNLLIFSGSEEIGVLVKSRSINAGRLPKDSGNDAILP